MSGSRVMIVEDDTDVREALAEALAEFGYVTDCAHDGQDALTQLRGGGTLPQVILLDIMMPVMDGWQFRAEQQNDPQLRHIPVVVITAVGDAMQKATAMDAAGALRKPVDLDELVTLIDRLAPRPN